MRKSILRFYGVRRDGTIRYMTELWGALQLSVAECPLKAPAPNPNKDNPSSFRADNLAETDGRFDADR